MKREIATPAVLAYFDSQVKHYIEKDASKKQLEAVFYRIAIWLYMPLIV